MYFQQSKTIIVVLLIEFYIYRKLRTPIKNAPLVSYFTVMNVMIIKKIEYSYTVNKRALRISLCFSTDYYCNAYSFLAMCTRYKIASQTLGLVLSLRGLCFLVETKTF